MDRAVTAACENDAFGTVLLGVRYGEFFGVTCVLGIKDLRTVAQIRGKRSYGLFQGLLPSFMNIRIHYENILQA